MGERRHGIVTSPTTSIQKLRSGSCLLQPVVSLASPEQVELKFTELTEGAHYHGKGSSTLSRKDCDLVLPSCTSGIADCARPVKATCAWIWQFRLETYNARTECISSFGAKQQCWKGKIRETGTLRLFAPRIREENQKTLHCRVTDIFPW